MDNVEANFRRYLNIIVAISALTLDKQGKKYFRPVGISFQAEMVILGYLWHKLALIKHKKNIVFLEKSNEIILGYLHQPENLITFEIYVISFWHLIKMAIWG